MNNFISHPNAWRDLGRAPATSANPPVLAKGTASGVAKRICKGLSIEASISVQSFMTGSLPSNHENPPQSPFCLSLTGKRLQRGRSLLPFVKGGAAVQSLITHASAASRLWRRTVGRDLRKLFSKQHVGSRQCQRLIIRPIRFFLFSGWPFLNDPAHQQSSLSRNRSSLPRRLSASSNQERKRWLQCSVSDLRFLRSADRRG